MWWLIYPFWVSNPRPGKPFHLHLPLSIVHLSPIPAVFSTMFLGPISGTRDVLALVLIPQLWYVGDEYSPIKSQVRGLMLFLFNSLMYVVSLLSDSNWLYCIFHSSIGRTAILGIKRESCCSKAGLFSSIMISVKREHVSLESLDILYYIFCTPVPHCII